MWIGWDLYVSPSKSSSPLVTDNGVATVAYRCH